MYILLKLCNGKYRLCVVTFGEGTVNKDIHFKYLDIHLKFKMFNSVKSTSKKIHFLLKLYHTFENKTFAIGYFSSNTSPISLC